MHGTCGLNNPWHRTSGRCHNRVGNPGRLPSVSLRLVGGQQDEPKQKMDLCEGRLTIKSNLAKSHLLAAIDPDNTGLGLGQISRGRDFRDANPVKQIWQNSARWPLISKILGCHFGQVQQTGF